MRGEEERAGSFLLFFSSCRHSHCCSYVFFLWLGGGLCLGLIFFSCLLFLEVINFFSYPRSKMVFRLLMPAY